jgi:tripartite-type tricarboxylate transporter receptor subunit TctC
MKFITRTALLSLSILASAAQAAWPEKPIRLISPYAPGGTNDTTARVVAEYLRVRLGQPVIVENKPGGNIRIGSQTVATSAPDGYTLLWTAAPHTVNPALYSDMPYDTLKAFVPVVHAVAIPVLFSLSPSTKATNLKGYLDLVKADPKMATVASPGAGSAPHLALELLISVSGAPLVHVPYKGDAPAVSDMIGGQIPAGFNAIGTSLPHVKAGKLRPIAIVAKERFADLPDVPTFAELGYPAVDANTWFGVVAPAGTPPAIVERLNKEINEILKNPEAKKRLADQGGVPIGGTPADFDKFIRADLVKWEKLAKSRNIKATD